MPTLPVSAAARRRAVRVAVRLGIVMLGSGAQTREVESTLRTVMEALGLPGAQAVVTYGTVTASYIASEDAEATTATQVVHRWDPNYDRLAAAAALVNAIRDGRTDLDAAEFELEAVVARTYPYPRWLGFAAPALLSMAVTIMFGGSAGDALAALGIGLAIQPALERIERSELTSFFQIVFGVSATALLVVFLVKAGLPINGGLVLTGSLLRFLPGAALVSGMHDFIDGAYVSGTARLVEVVLLGAAIAGAASLVLAFGLNVDVELQITSSGFVEWPGVVLVVAGAFAVACYAFRLGVPSRALLSAAVLGGVAVVVVRGLTPVSAELSQPARTLVAAVVIGVVGRILAYRAGAPAALWLVPAILPLLPAPSTLLPLLASTEAARDALQGQALNIAFVIGVGVASGSIILQTIQRYRERVLQPVAEAVSTRVGHPVRTWAKRWRRARRSARN